MNPRFASTILSLMLAGWCVPAAMGTPWNAESQKSDSPKSAPKPAGKAVTALSGCIDQAADGRFILIQDGTREKIATLVAEGFPTEGFAKHLGQRVTVRGTASPDGSSSSFRVRSIQVISESCAAQ